MNFMCNFFHVSGSVEMLAIESITNFPIKDNKVYFNLNLSLKNKKFKRTAFISNIKYIYFLKHTEPKPLNSSVPK